MLWVRDCAIPSLSPNTQAESFSLDSSASRAMLNYILRFTLIAFVSAGCSKQPEQTSAPVGSQDIDTRTLRAVAPPTVLPHQLITTFGDYPINRLLDLCVQERTLEVRTNWKRRVPGDVNSAFSMGLGEWRARAGWFAFVENSRRLWLYDGDRCLLLYESPRTRSGGPGSWSGPTQFDCPLPETVLPRISAAAKKAIKQND
jgi:hypothetical protein